MTTDMNGLDGLTEDQIKALLATSGDQFKLGQIQDQGRMADKLRAAAFEDHPGTTVGHQYLPDIGGTLAAGLGAIKGNRMAKQGDAAAAGIFSNQQAVQLPFVQALIAKLNKKDDPMDTADSFYGGPGSA